MANKLGKTQASMLRSLQQHGSWSRGCGWYWNNISTTERILDRLVARGLATRTSEVLPASRFYDARTRTTYHPAEEA